MVMKGCKAATLEIKATDNEIVRQFIRGEVEGPITQGAGFGGKLS